MQKTLIIVIIAILLSNFSYCQIIFDQGIIKGGITGGGFSTGKGTGTGTFDIHIESNSTIKNAYLFTYRIGYPSSSEFIINGVPIVFDTSKHVSNVNYPSQFSTPINIYYFDYKNFIDSSITTYTVTVPTPSTTTVNWGYWTIFLCVTYENANLLTTNYSIIINDKDYIGNEIYQINNLNPFDTINPIGLSIYTDGTGSYFKKNNEIKVNNNLIGTVGGSDIGSTLYNFAGVKGHFYYQNNQLFGLADDTPDNIMDSTDGLANISHLINQNSTNLSLNLSHVDYPSQNPGATNINIGYILAYTTPCDTFSTTVTEQVNICIGDTAYLSVTGGNNTLATTYEWEPQEGLSCYNCATPYYTDTVSKWYTVRIWNTDSCSKVIPVNIHVNDNPQPPIVATSTTQCSDSSGVALVTVVDATYMYSANNGTPQISNGIANLWGGNHTITVTDTNGCTASSVVNVPVYYPTANFTASPLQGDVPLEVTFTNTSSNATQYIWYINNDTLFSESPTHTFNQSGQFPATLIAIDTYPQCADTASVIIFAEYPFTVVAPSFYEYQEDKYTIYTSGVKELNYTLYNTIGQKVYNTSYSNGSDTALHLSLWTGNDVAKGTYLYRIIAQGIDGTEKVFSGKVVVM